MRKNRLKPQSLSDMPGDLSDLTDYNPSTEGQSLPAGTKLSDLLKDPRPQPARVSSFENGMLKAVRELNQKPQLLREVSKRIS
jgi:hypothetical protein